MRATVALGIACVLAFGCDVILGIEHRQPLAEGVGGGGTSATGGEGGVGGTQAVCESPFEGDIDNCGGPGEECVLRANSVPHCTDCVCGFTCNLGYGDCDGDATNGCETDLRSDNTHCGACGFGCENPGCDDGTCVMVEQYTTEIRTFGDSFYFTGVSHVARCALTGCNLVPTTVATGTGSTRDLEVDASGVVWVAANPNNIWHCADPSGCTGEILIDQAPSRVFVDEDHMLWGSGEGLTHVPRGGGALSVIDAGMPYNTDVVLEGDVLFYGYVGTSSEVGWCSFASCATTRMPLATISGSLFGGIALDETHVYFRTGSGVSRVPRDGSDPAVVIAAQGNDIRDWRIDATHLYWIELNSVRRVLKSGGSPENLRPTPGLAGALAIDGELGYVAEGQRIVRFPLSW